MKAEQLHVSGAAVKQLNKMLEKYRAPQKGLSNRSFSLLRVQIPPTMYLFSVANKNKSKSM